METTLYIFNENGLIPSEALNEFSKRIQSQSKFNFRILDKADIDSASTIFKKLTTDGLEFIVYDYGYVMKTEGEIIKTIFLLKEIDEVIPMNKEFFISPLQAIQNSEENKFPRGGNIQRIGYFLDQLFNNKNYSSALENV
jgi:GMP synthase PP-ATPase subunit